MSKDINITGKTIKQVFEEIVEKSVFNSMPRTESNIKSQSTTPSESEKCFICHDLLEAGQTCATVHTSCLAICNHGAESEKLNGTLPQGASFSEKIWISQFVEVDGVGVLLKRQGEKWVLSVSGSTEYVVDITNLFIQARQELLTQLLDEMPKEKECSIGADDEETEIAFQRGTGWNSALAKIRTLLESKKNI